LHQAISIACEAHGVRHLFGLPMRFHEERVGAVIDWPLVRLAQRCQFFGLAPSALLGLCILVLALTLDVEKRAFMGRHMIQ